MRRVMSGCKLNHTPLYPDASVIARRNGCDYAGNGRKNRRAVRLEKLDRTVETETRGQGAVLGFLRFEQHIHVTITVSFGVELP